MYKKRVYTTCISVKNHFFFDRQVQISSADAPPSVTENAGVPACEKSILQKDCPKSGKLRDLAVISPTNGGKMGYLRANGLTICDKQAV